MSTTIFSNHRLNQPIPDEVFSTIRRFETPYVIFDFVGIRHAVREYQHSIALLGNAKLNFALKACYEPDILRLLCDERLGVDVASSNEFKLAQRMGFREISATGPSFIYPDQVDMLKRAQSILDFSSYDQLVRLTSDAYTNGNKVIGLRVRVAFPHEIEDEGTFGRNSRFGINPFNEQLRDYLKSQKLIVERLHFHTGQLSPARLLYEFEYCKRIIAEYPTIKTIDFGGGFYTLFAHRNETERVFSYIKAINETEYANSLQFRFEPGAGLIGPFGYLVATVISLEHGNRYFEDDLIGLDCSAWNMCPWIIPRIYHYQKARRGVEYHQAIVCGNSLYENDFFGKSQQNHIPRLRVPNDLRVGDKIIVTNFGAYTYTNFRNFNLLGIPKKYGYDNKQGKDTQQVFEMKDGD